MKHSDHQYKLLVLSCGDIQNNILICPRTGILRMCQNPYYKGFQAENLPIVLSLIDLKTDSISPGDIFVLRNDYDDFYYCTNIINDSVSGRKICFNDRIYFEGEPTFEHYPLKNVQKVVSTSLKGFYHLPQLGEIEIIALIDFYNNNKIDKYYYNVTK